MSTPGFPILSLCFSPLRSYVALASGDKVVVLDLRRKSFVGTPISIKMASSLSWSPDGRYLAMTGDDKCVTVCTMTTDGLIVHSRRSLRKKISCVHIARLPIPEAPLVVLCSTKLGDVWACQVAGDSTEMLPPAYLLGHCSPVTAMTLSSDGRYLLTAEKDEKIRISSFPSAFEIVGYCLGHTQAVTAMCMARTATLPECVVSGAADSTVHAWRLTDGALLGSATFSPPTGVCTASTPAPAHAPTNGPPTNGPAQLAAMPPVIAGLATSVTEPDLIAVIREGIPEVLLFRIRASDDIGNAPSALIFDSVAALALPAPPLHIAFGITPAPAGEATEELWISLTPQEAVPLLVAYRRDTTGRWSHIGEGEPVQLINTTLADVVGVPESAVTVSAIIAAHRPSRWRKFYNALQFPRKQQKKGKPREGEDDEDEEEEEDMGE